MAEEKKQREWTLKEIEELVSVERILGPADIRICGIAIDSRQVVPGNLFIALRGERTDGHLYIHDAIERGAIAVMISKDIPMPETITTIRVRDTRKALEQWAQGVRNQIHAHVIGITGSAGKTTTKELLGWVLGEVAPVFISPGNLNSTTGIPLCMINYSHRRSTYWIQETGINQQGEMDKIGALLRPDTAILLNALPVHLEGLASVENVAREKSRLVYHTHPEGRIVSNADDRHLTYYINRFKHPDQVWLTWSMNTPSADVILTSFSFKQGYQDLIFKVREKGQKKFREWRFRYPGTQPWMPSVISAVLTTLYALEIPLSMLARRLPEFCPPEKRGQVYYLNDDIILFDDSYNANPEAVSLAVQWFRSYPDRRHGLILGDMLELGPKELDYHRQLARKIDWDEIDLFVAVGPRMKVLANELKTCGYPVEIFVFPDASAAARVVPNLLKPGDAWLIKGSRGMLLDTLTHAILKSKPPSSPGLVNPSVREDNHVL